MSYLKSKFQNFIYPVILFVALLYPTTKISAQAGNKIDKGQTIREAIVKGFGGKAALESISRLEYTIQRTGYDADTSHKTIVYQLDLLNKFIFVKEYTQTDTIEKSIDATGAWIRQSGRRMPLPKSDAQKLNQVFLTNFIPMLQNNSLAFEYIKSTRYQKQKVNIVRVYTADKQSIIFDLFVAADGRIVTSSKPDVETGEYLYFADELDYKPIGGGLIFPVVYKIWREGHLAAQGVFTDMVVK